VILIVLSRILARNEEKLFINEEEKKPLPLSGSDHFNATTSTQEIEKSSKEFIPANTLSSTNWAVWVFLD